MNIGIISHPSYGGSGIVATELGMALADKNHKIHFISYSKPVRLNINSNNIFFHKVYIQSYPLFEYIPYGIALASKIVKVVKTYNLNLIHIHYAIPHSYDAYIAKKILKEEGIHIPIITTLHGSDVNIIGKNPIYKDSVEFSINHSDYITSVSNSLKNDTLKIFNIKKEIIIIPNFIDHNKCMNKNISIRNLYAQKDEKILIHISNLRPIKRVLDLIKIFRKVLKKIKSTLIIIGEGPEFNNLKKIIKFYNLNEKVKLLGNINNLFSILSISDLFLLPSELESFGLGALEAMSHSIPVICSNIGGLSEVVTNKYSGFLEKVGDIDSMAKRSIELLSNQTKLSKFKRNAYIDSQRFQKKKILPKYIKLYQVALKM